MRLSPKDLRTLLEKTYSSDAPQWSGKTIDIRDLVRRAHLAAGEAPYNGECFRKTSTPGEWNEAGIASIIETYHTLSPALQDEFVSTCGLLIGTQ